MFITNATTLRKNMFNYLDAVATNADKIIVTTKNGTVAIVSEQYLRGLEETCNLSTIPSMSQSIIEGLKTPISECLEIDWENQLK